MLSLLLRPLSPLRHDVAQPSTKLISSLLIHYYEPIASSYELCLATAYVRPFPFLLLFVDYLSAGHRQTSSDIKKSLRSSV